ncbi:hypothetical protein PPYR_03612 [Photinus pyralis]|uniref:CUB domain-containing protein n=1 Tax=Photinus pyralis TaxID=7054 RepID=A0A5N4A3D4_PHOPY|nr:hypothetical protein PPYR_03612 [Photinus pyralis]
MSRYCLNVLIVVVSVCNRIWAEQYFERYYDRYRSPNQRHYDAYKSSMETKGQQYIYPKSPNSFYYKPHEYYSDELKFNSDLLEDSRDVDFGNFVTTQSSYQFPFERKGRPKFKTAKNDTDPFDYAYLTNVDKTRRYDQQNKIDKVLEGKINEHLKIYFHKLLKKLQKNGGGAPEGSKQEFLELSDEVDDGDVEALIQSDEAPNYYDMKENYVFNKTKKFFDAHKITMLKNSTHLLAKKFLSLFTIIKFANSACTGSNGVNTYEGTCYYESECEARNGTTMGVCAEGYGVCCVFIRSCGATSSQNCTYFESPSYPNYYPSNGSIVPPTVPPASNGTIDPRLRYQVMMFLARQEMTSNSLSCTFQLQKISDNVRQLRVDFLDLELRGPVNGSCTVERFVISSHNRNNLVPDICGYNTGQHMYVDITDVSGPIQIGVLAMAVERKRFRIRVCQVTECSNPLNCLQYHTGVTGVISSFNYDQASSLSRSVPEYYNNLNYAICIRKEKGYCSITYTNVANGTAYQFQLRNFDEAGLSTTAPGQAGSEIFGCPDDYIVINGVRLCGERFNDGSVTIDLTMNAPVTDNTGGPFIIPFKTNSRATGRGFRLFYRQNMCTT